MKTSPPGGLSLFPEKKSAVDLVLAQRSADADRHIGVFTFSPITPHTTVREAADLYLQDLALQVDATLIAAGRVGPRSTGETPVSEEPAGYAHKECSTNPRQELPRG